MDNLPAASFPSRLVAARDTFIVAAVLGAVLTWTPDALTFLAIFLGSWALLYGGFEAVRFFFGREKDDRPDAE
jgi:Sec-independent protein secretion pathway component TatC